MITFNNDKKLFQHITDCLDINMPLVLVGSPGIGKSHKAQSVVKSRGSDLHVFASQLSKQSKFVGYNFINRDKNSMELFLSEWSQILLNAKKETVFYFEDLLLADDDFQKAIMSLIWLREIDGRPLSKHIRFIMDSNDNSHGALRGQINTALNNRVSICTIGVDVNGWLQWALSNGIAKEIILFIHANPSFLYTDTIPKGSYTAYNTLRSWTNLSPFVNLGRRDIEVINSIIGNNDNVAAEFLNFWESLDTYGNLIAKVKADPATAPLFDSNQADKVLGAVFILSNHLEKSNVGKFVKYINRYNNNEYTNLLLALGVETHPDAKETPEYVNYITNHE